jgi:hypothetical protein
MTYRNTDKRPDIDKLFGLRPSVTETVQRSAHTEVTIPVRQAQTASLILFTGYLSTLMALLLGGATVYFLAFTDIQWPGLVTLCILVVGALAWHASRRPMAILLERMMGEIADPNRDSELLEILRELQARQQPETRVVYEPVPVRVNGEPLEMGEPADSPQPSTAFLDLVEFAELAAVRGLERSAWLPANGPRVRLASGQFVTRSAYDRLTGELCGWQFVERTPSGYAWLIAPERATALLCRMADRAGSGQAGNGGDITRLPGGGE